MINLHNCQNCPIYNNLGHATLEENETPEHVEILILHTEFTRTNWVVIHKLLDHFGVTSSVAFQRVPLCNPLNQTQHLKLATLACKDNIFEIIRRIKPSRIISLGATPVSGLNVKTTSYDWQYILNIPTLILPAMYELESKPEIFQTFYRLFQKAVCGNLTWEEPPAYALDKTNEYIELAEAAGICSLDIETGVGFELYNNVVFCAGSYHPSFGKPYVFSMAEFNSPKFKNWLNSTTVTFVGNNISLFDAKILYHSTGVNLKSVYDTLHCDYVKNEEQTSGSAIVKRGLGFLASVLLDTPDYKTAMKPYIKTMLLAPPDLAHQYVSWDAYCSWLVYEKITSTFSPRENRLYFNFLHPLDQKLRQMSNRGVLIDKDHLVRLQDTITVEIDKLAENFPVNYKSPKQLAELFFDRWGLKEVLGRSTNKDVLAILQTNYPDIPELQNLAEIRKLEKISSTYCTGILTKLDKNNYLHANFSVAGTNTGRLSSSDPNLQNIPEHTELGREIKRAFIVPENYSFFFNIDYSSLEVRLVTIYSQDKTLIDLYAQGLDLHRYAASIYFKVDYDAVTKEQRQWIKAGVFGVLYGLTEQGAGISLGTSTAEGVRLVRALKQDIFPGLGKFIDSVQKLALSRMEVPYLDSDRVRRFPLITERTKPGVLKHSLNSIIQGRGSDFSGTAIINSDFDGTRLQVHDNLAGYANTMDEVQELVDLMEVRDYCVPLVTEVKVGPNWADCK